MSYKKILHSENLIKIYKEGKLENVLKKFSDHINEKNYLGAGTHAASFKYNKGEQVLKICTKQIPYFKNYPLRRRYGHAQQFKEDVDQLSPYLLPINEILYEDDHVFIYTQNYCSKFNIDTINQKIVSKIFEMVHLLVSENILLGDIAPNNFGLIKGQIYLYDYHDLQPICLHGQQLKTSWWRSPMKNLTRYITALYYPNKYLKYTELMENYNFDVYKKMKKNCQLPSPFFKLLDYIKDTPDNVSLSYFCTLIAKCVFFLTI